MKIKTIGRFGNCIATKDESYFIGTTRDGQPICADEQDVEKGFQLFVDYHLSIESDAAADVDVPFIGIHKRASIRRHVLFSHIPEWLRIADVAKLLQQHAKRPTYARAVQCIAQLERLDLSRLRMISEPLYPSPFPA